MSILVKGMEMPVSCSDCKIRLSVGCCGNLPQNTRMPNCPLVEVPKHGDLIDRNKLYEKTAKWEADALKMVTQFSGNDNNQDEWKRWSIILTERTAFKFDVADAPTVIEAEEGE